MILYVSCQCCAQPNRHWMENYSAYIFYAKCWRKNIILNSRCHIPQYSRVLSKYGIWISYLSSIKLSASVGVALPPRPPVCSTNVCYSPKTWGVWIKACTSTYVGSTVMLPKNKYSCHWSYQPQMWNDTTLSTHNNKHVMNIYCS